MHKLNVSDKLSYNEHMLKRLHVKFVMKNTQKNFNGVHKKKKLHKK